MLIATVEFLLGTYRADPDGTAHTGRLERGEWPPAPSRLFDALVDADGTRDRCRHTDGTELEFLERAGPPVIAATDGIHHQELLPRFVASWSASFDRDNKTRELSTHQEYVGRKGTEVRPGVRVAPRVPTVRYLWDSDISGKHLRALGTRAARIAYLGCADSPVRVRFETTQGKDDIDGPQLYVPDPGGELALGVPQAGRLDALDSAFDQWTNDGKTKSVGRYQFPALATKARYRLPQRAGRPVNMGRIVASLILRPAVSGRRVSAVTAAFKAAVLDRHQAMYGEPPSVLHGHGYGSTGYDLARFLALPDVGHAHASSRIHGVAMWLPADVDVAVVGRIREVVRSIPELVGRSFRSQVEVWDRQRRPRAADPRRWTGPSRWWATVFPAVVERHGPISLGEICRWCKHAGAPEPIAIRHSRSPLVHGAVSLAPSEVHRPDRPGRPYCHIELVFAEPVTGPIVIGSGRQRGLGLCAPIPEGS